MALDLDFDGDLAQAVSDLPGTLTWGGADYAACIDPIGNSEDSETIAGVFARANFTATIRTVLFTGARPAIGELVTIGGTSYRITRTSTDEAGDGIELTLQEATA